MFNFILKMLVVSIGLGLGNGAMAATISLGTPAVFAFDSSAISIETAFTSQSWGQSPGVVAAATDTDETLGAGKSYTVSFGSVVGGNQFGGFTYTNNGFRRPINNLGGPIRSSILMTVNGTLILPALVDVFYASFSYVDDVYSVDVANFGVHSHAANRGFQLAGKLVEGPLVVPLPAALPMLGAGLFGFVALGRRRKRRAG